METLDEKEEERKWPQKKKSTIGNNIVLLRMLEQPVLQQSGSNAGENIGAGQQVNCNLHVF